MAPSACSSRARCFTSTRAWARHNKQHPAIRPVCRWIVPSTRASAAPSSAQSSATLVTLTVDEEYQIEIAFLQAQVDHLTDVRDRILGLDDESQVRIFAHWNTYVYIIIVECVKEHLPRCAQVSMLRGVSEVSRTLQEHRYFVSDPCVTLPYIKLCRSTCRAARIQRLCLRWRF